MITIFSLSQKNSKIFHPTELVIMLILESFRFTEKNLCFVVRCSTTIMRFGEASGLDWRPVVSAVTFVAFFLAAMILFLTSLHVNLQIIGLGPALAFLMGVQCQGPIILSLIVRKVHLVLEHIFACICMR